MSTPYMNLDLPSPLVTLGPTWATLLNAAFGDVDAHDHTAGRGLPITPAAINVDADLDFQSHTAANVQAINLATQAASLALPSRLQSINGDLYWTNAGGTDVAITQGGAIAGAPGSISNLVPPAAAVYDASNQYVRFFTTATIMAGLDIGFLSLRQSRSPTDPTFSLTMPTTGIAPGVNIGWQLPPTIPAASPGYGILAARYSTINSANLEYQVFDNASIESVPVGGVYTIRVKNDGITNAKILEGAVTGGISGTSPTGSIAYRTIATENIANFAITNDKLGTASVTGGVSGVTPTGKIAYRTIATENLEQLAITSAKIAVGAVTGGTAGGLATNQIAYRTITSENIQQLAVTQAELAANAVETAKIADGAVTPSKRPLLLGYGEYTDVTVPINMPSATWYVPAVTDVQGVNLIGGRPFTISLQGNSSGGPESEFTLQNRSVVNVDATFILDVYVYSRANAVVLRGWRSRFTVRAGGGFQSFPSLTWQDTANNSRNDCIVTMRIKGSGTDIWLHRLENFYWTLWQ